MALRADLLKMGQDKVGSYALAGSKTNIVAMAIEDVLQEIADVLNHDLIRHTYELNGWDVTKAPVFKYGDLDDVSLDEFSKALQRMAATSSVEIDREMLNLSRKAMGAKPLAEDLPPQKEYLPAFASRSGDGLAKGSGNGTSDQPAGRDNSTSNAENSAPSGFVYVTMNGKEILLSEEDYVEWKEEGLLNE